MKSIHLKLIKGENVYNAKGDLINESLTIKLIYNSKEYESVLTTLFQSGYSKAQVVKVLDLEKKELQLYRKQLALLLRNPNADFKSIQELEYKIELLKNEPYNELEVLEYQKEINKRLGLDSAEPLAQQEKKLQVVVDEKTDFTDELDSTDELELLRADFEELYGKRPHGALKEEKLKEAIENKKKQLLNL